MIELTYPRNDDERAELAANGAHADQLTQRLIAFVETQFTPPITLNDLEVMLNVLVNLLANTVINIYGREMPDDVLGLHYQTLAEGFHAVMDQHLALVMAPEEQPN